MFLVGGPAFSGTTLLALLFNQGDLVCLDEPDFGDPKQAHRGVPVLERIFPGVAFPRPPSEALALAEAFEFMRECARAIRPKVLGIKTCNYRFVEFARLYRKAGFPVVAIVRDIRDALVNPLPEWCTEADLNNHYRVVWNNLDLVDAWVRYEDLVADPGATMSAFSPVLGRGLVAPASWAEDAVHESMMKLPRHRLLKSGSISSERVGLWRTSGRSFSLDTRETARLMGYGE
jgi:hypothetical protein